MKRLVGFLLFLVIVGGGAFYILKNYYPYLIPPSKNVKQYLPLSGDTYSPITVPSGFRLDLFADLHGGLPQVLAFDDRGTLVVAITNAGKIVALPDIGEDLKVDQKRDILKGLKKPHGIIFDKQYLYVTESDKVSRYDYNPDTFDLGVKEILFEFPDEANSTRTLRVKEDKLYISDPQNFSILESNLDGTDLKVFETIQSGSGYFTFDNTGKIYSLDNSYGLTIDNNGDLLVATENKILKFGLFAGTVQSMSNFVSGFVQGEETLGRPSDIIIDNKGRFFISDGKNGLIYVLSK